MQLAPAPCVRLDAATLDRTEQSESFYADKTAPRGATTAGIAIAIQPMKMPGAKRLLGLRTPAPFD
jgi:hypothetical protein